jgi:hypothetical protein
VRFQVLKPEGFELQSASRLPYLSEGEYDCPLFTLDDAILVLSVPVSPPPPESGVCVAVRTFL